MTPVAQCASVPMHTSEDTSESSSEIHSRTVEYPDKICEFR